MYCLGTTGIQDQVGGHSLLMSIMTILSFRLISGGGGTYCWRECRSSSETLRQGSSSLIMQSISLNSASTGTMPSRLSSALLRVKSAGMVTLLVKEAVRLPSLMGMRCDSEACGGGAQQLKMLEWQLMAILGCLSELPVSLSAFQVVCRMMVSLRHLTSSSNSSFFIRSTLSSLSKRISFSNISFSLCSLMDLWTYNFSIRPLSLASSSSFAD